MKHGESQMRQRLTEPDERQLSTEERGQRNRKALIGFLLLCTIAFFLVSSLPTALIPPAIAKLLAFASFGAAFVAALHRDRLFAEHFTRWDQAAALMALSLLAGLLTDPAAVGAALERLAFEAPAPQAPPPLDPASPVTPPGL